MLSRRDGVADGWGVRTFGTRHDAVRLPVECLLESLLSEPTAVTVRLLFGGLDCAGHLQMLLQCWKRLSSPSLGLRILPAAGLFLKQCDGLLMRGDHMRHISAIEISP